MSDKGEQEFFELRKEGMTYISKLFRWNRQDTDGKRNIKMVMEDCDEIGIGEIEGAMCLRLSLAKYKTQITAVVSQDNKQVRRLSFQTFKNRAGDWIEATDEHKFTFHNEEFERLLRFLARIEFIDLSNHERFQIEDISVQPGAKLIVDKPDDSVLTALKELSSEQRKGLLGNLRGNLTTEETNILLGRKQGLHEFASHMEQNDWNEPEWQDFFEREQWVFGYGLDYRIMRPFDREMTVGSGGTDNKNKPVVDFLQTFKDYTVLVEIKRPDTPIFKPNKGARAGTWEFSQEFIGAVSQIIEQKAEWLAFAQTGEHFNKDGTESLLARTRNAKSILVVGTLNEFEVGSNERDNNVRRDTFELFRRENRTIDIITFDELLERAKFITQD